MTCPACGFTVSVGECECPRCGIVFAHWRGGRDAFTRRAGEPDGRETAPAHGARSPSGIAPTRGTDLVADALGLRAGERPGGDDSSRPPEPTEDSAPSARSRGMDLQPAPPPARNARPFHLRSEPTPGPNRDLAVLVAHADATDEVTYFGVAAAGWRAIGVGALAAGFVLHFPLLRFVTSTLVTLVHEMGHAIAGWVLGHPSLPAFDFVYGGGVTLRNDRVLLIPIVVAGGLAWLAHRLRANPRGRQLAIGALLAYGLVASSDRIGDVVITAAGHGGELVFAAVFLHRALSGRGCTLAAERPLYGFLACFVFASDVGFAFGLLTSEEARRLYADAKGGGHWMDFSRLAEELIGTTVPRIAATFLAAVVATPPLVWWFEMHRTRVEQWLTDALAVEAPGSTPH